MTENAAKEKPFPMQGVMHRPRALLPGKKTPAPHAVYADLRMNGDPDRIPRPFRDDSLRTGTLSSA